MAQKIIAPRRAQNPNIPLGECSQCYLPSFVAAAGGAKGMHNVYSLGSTNNDSKLALSEQKTNPVAKATAAAYATYFAGMKVAGFTSSEVVSGSIEGWNGGTEMAWAIRKAGGLDETADLHALQHPT